MPIWFQSPPPATPVLFFKPNTDEGVPGGTVAYRLRWVQDTGDKEWTSDDLTRPHVTVSFSAAPKVIRTDPPTGEYRRCDVRQYSDIAALSGVYDFGLTAVDAAGNESGFLDLENARLEI